MPPATANALFVTMTPSPMPVSTISPATVTLTAMLLPAVATKTATPTPTLIPLSPSNAITANLDPRSQPASARTATVVTAKSFMSPVIPTNTPPGADPMLTSIIGPILANPAAYVNQEIVIIGYYRGWDLLDEAGFEPPLTRSDWVIKDASGAIYVVTPRDFTWTLDLNPASLEDTTQRLHLVGLIQVNEHGQPYLVLQALELEPD